MPTIIYTAEYFEHFFVKIKGISKTQISLIFETLDLPTIESSLESDGQDFLKVKTIGNKKVLSIM